MKKINLFLLVALLLTGNALFTSNLFGQLIDTTMLCQGAYYTEAEGKAALKNFASNYNDKNSWEKRAGLIRKGINQVAGLSSLPMQTPLRPIIHSRKVYDGYTVENLAFESLPGFFVTGNLYRPVQNQSSYAAILSPHGHGPDLRFKEDVQKRCAGLARMGAIVLAYDMVGYGDANQCSHKHPHALTLQIQNSKRALDFLISLPGVDPKRIGVTGESGEVHKPFYLHRWINELPSLFRWSWFLPTSLADVPAKAECLFIKAGITKPAMWKLPP